MLNNIPAVLSPELLKVLCEMGHGDRICIGDGNFPGSSVAKQNNCIFLRADGHGVLEFLDSILQMIPLDTYVDTPVMLMQKTDNDRNLDIPIWEQFYNTVAKYDNRGASAIGYYDRFVFYEEAKKCYCVLMTGEKSVYANIIIQKGVIK